MTITIKPSYRQFLADNYGFIAITFLVSLVTPCSIFLHGRFQLPLLDSTAAGYVRTFLSVAAFAMWMAIFLRYAVLASRSWVINDDTIRIQYGIMSKSVNYVELYRIVDYKETQSFMQRLLGMKTVEILSTDRSDPSLRIFGIPSDMNLVESIRKKVEKCKHENKIFEVANSVN